MKRLLFLLLIFVCLNSFSQIRFRYGLTAGMNVATALLPELKLNTDINNILKGENVVQGNHQLADYIALYKGGVFVRLDAIIGSLKLNVNYDKTNIHHNLDPNVYSVNELNIVLSYLNFEITGNINLTKHFFISIGYVPTLLLHQNGNLNINKFDPKILSGFGIRISDSVTIDLDVLYGVKEIIDGSYIHNLIIPVTINIPLN